MTVDRNVFTCCEAVVFFCSRSFFWIWSCRSCFSLFSWEAFSVNEVTTQDKYQCNPPAHQADVHSVFLMVSHITAQSFVVALSSELLKRKLEIIPIHQIFTVHDLKMRVLLERRFILMTSLRRPQTLHRVTVEQHFSSPAWLMDHFEV